MFKISTNLGIVARQLERELRELEDRLDEYLNRAAMDAIAIVADRIQQEGRNTAGQTMLSKSPERLAAYSKAYAEYRRARGRQVSKVDFTMEGQLMNSFHVIGKGEKEVIVGFLTAGINDIAEWLEEYFGPAFYLSESEKKVVLDNLAADVLAHVS